MTTAQLNWLLNDLVTRVSDIRHAIVLSSDGLLLATSDGLEPDDADRLSAVAASLQSLAAAAADYAGGGQIKQTLVEWQQLILRVTIAGHGARLAALTTHDADLGLLAYEMEMLIAKVGQHLSTSARLTPADAAGLRAGEVA
ncbi:roadblock/LC7 domain-containing protein [Nonomuraea sp. NPDC003804]|uniref:roadblock/LC7 domain-containing protein n=1 Tax=Nonomuraea sp. NPDC003804 TaxID=3154547 RepID=UPI0033B7F432